MIACNKCRNEIAQGVAYVTMQAVAGPRLDWHLKSYGQQPQPKADERK